jgi:predicted aspartyl protease
MVVRFALAGFFALVVVAQARAECSVSEIAVLPVTVSDLRALAHVKINGTDATLVVDSGDFFNSLTLTAARKAHTAVGPAPKDMRVGGVGGFSEDLAVAEANDFTFGGALYHHVNFVVIGGEIDEGVAGMLGQNILDVADVEYDLADGVVRLFKPTGCDQAMLAYWAQPENVSVVDIRPFDAADRGAQDTTAEASINGHKIRVEFDTGADRSTLSLAAAARAGVRPTDPTSQAAGSMMGIARNSQKRTWIAPFDSFELGGERVGRIRLRIGDLGTDVDMLLGADFFLSHRVYVANSQHKLYFTYTGGPVFQPGDPLGDKPSDRGPHGDKSAP